MEDNIPKDESVVKPNPIVGQVFGWKHVFIRVAVVFLVTATLSYLQAAKIINFKLAEAQLLVPAVAGLLIAILNLRHLNKLAILIFPIWLAAAIAIGFAGLLIAKTLGLERGDYIWVDLLVQYFPFAVGGHWLYMGYERLSKSKSFSIYLGIVSTSVLSAFFAFQSEVNVFLLQTIFLSIVTFLLSALHRGEPLGKPKV